MLKLGLKYVIYEGSAHPVVDPSVPIKENSMAELGQWDIFDKRIPPERATLKNISLVEANKGIGHIQKENEDEKDH